MDLEALDLTDLDVFAQGFPYPLFAELRRRAPVWWQAPTAHTPGGEGFWVVTRHADVERVARDQATFSSQSGPGRSGAGGTIIEDLPDGIGPGVMLNMCDPPVHTRIRGLVSRGFTPKGLRPLQPFLAARAAAIVDDRLADGWRLRLPRRRRRGAPAPDHRPDHGRPPGRPAPAVRVDVDDPRLP